MTPLAAQLPAGQHRLHAGHALALLQGTVKEREGQKHPRPGQRRAGLGCGEAAQAHGTEALGEFKTPGPTQFEAVAASTGGQAEPWSAIPEEAEAIALLQLTEQGHGVPPRDGHGQAEHALSLKQALSFGRRRQQFAEAGCDAGWSLQPRRADAAAQMYGPSRTPSWLRPLPSPRSSQAFMPPRRNAGGCGRRRSSGRCIRWR